MNVWLIAATITTLPPNFVIVGIDQQKNLMLVHQVEPSDVPEIGSV